MNYTADQVLNGLMKYADAEVIGKLPTTGQFLMGTAIALASSKAENVIDGIMHNSVVKMLGIVDDEGMIDVDALIMAMKESADKYGKITFDVPMIGRLTFSSNDVERLRAYIR